MRRAWIAAALLALVSAAGCGADPRELEPGMKAAVREYALAAVRKDKEAIKAFILPDAGMAGSPLAAQDANTPEGRERLHDANVRWTLRVFKDSGILSEADVENFMNAIKFSLDATSAWINFEIAAEGRRAAEVVTFRLTRTQEKWRMYSYSREMKGMR
jgi:hypothetical protein